MPHITAAQHIFSSVPAAQSPRRRQGYQTLFVTRGVPDEVIRAIEDRAQYATAPGDPVKHQFYPLPDRLVAISQTVPLAERDEFGRKGLYLTHTLILHSGDLAPFGYCPLDFFDQFPFATALAPLFQVAKPGSDEFPPARAAITFNWPAAVFQLARSLPRESLIALGRLGWQAGRLLEKRETVALLGQDADQRAVLGLIFLLASPMERTWLSFDTHAAGCQWDREVRFWAQGYPQATDAREALRVEAASRKVITPLNGAEDGPFGIWMQREALLMPLERIWPYLEPAGRLAAALVGEPPPGTAAIPNDFIERFARHNADAVAARWLRLLPAGLSNGLTGALSAEVARRPGHHLRQILNGSGQQSLNRWMFNHLLSLGGAPAREDRQPLEGWIKSTPHPGLNALPPLWKKDVKTWVARLGALGEEDYGLMVSSLARWMEPPIPLREALIPGRETAWLSGCAFSLSAAEWKKTLPILEKSGSGALAELALLALNLKEPAQAAIRDWLKGARVEAPALRAALGLPVREERKGFRLFG